MDCGRNNKQTERSKKMKKKVEQILQSFFNDNSGEKVTSWNFQMLGLTIINVIDQQQELTKNEIEGYKKRIAVLQDDKDRGE